MVECLRKSESRGDKIARVNSILNSKSINLHEFCTVFGVLCDVDILKLTARAQSIYRDVNVCIQIYVWIIIFYSAKTQVRATCLHITLYSACRVISLYNRVNCVYYSVYSC